MPDPAARAWLESVASGFTELEPVDVAPRTPAKRRADGPIGWPGYAAALARAAARTGESESVVCGQGRIGGTDAVLVAFDFRFLGGSMGEATGARIVQALRYAVLAELPVVSMLATGGSRMQEGMAALRQLQWLARGQASLRANGLPHIAVLRDPTTGGVWATLGAGADVTVALRGAQVGFAGSRVRPEPHADDPAYTAAGQLAAGQVDELVAEESLGDVLAGWLGLLTGQRYGDPEAAPVPRALGSALPVSDGWDAVRLARARERPRAGAYLDDYFTTRRLLSGDRCGGVDPGMLCGFGRHAGRPVGFAAQTGTANTPAGFRTATRLVRLAERVNLPVLTLVDTPGAAADPAAERGGLAPAIAELFAAVGGASVPVTTLVVGEGGSGGALALCAPDHTWIAPDGYFSVIAPELAAAILKRDAAEVPGIARQLRLRPQDLVELGVVRGIAGARR